MLNALEIAENLTAQNILLRLKVLVVTIESVAPHTVDDFPEPCRSVFRVVVDSVVDDMVHDEFLQFFGLRHNMCWGM